MDADMLKSIASSFPLPTKLPLPLEQYAALVAREEHTSPEDLLALHSEFAIADDVHRKRIDQEFGSALAQDAKLREQFADLLARWKAWVAGQKGS